MHFLLQARIHYRLHSCVDFIKSYSATPSANILHMGKKIILCPLTPQQVREDQNILKKKDRK